MAAKSNGYSDVRASLMGALDSMAAARALTGTLARMEAGSDTHDATGKAAAFTLAQMVARIETALDAAKKIQGEAAPKVAKPAK